MFNITFQQLEVFQAVADKLNMTEAAESLFVSQSALSKTISRLEDSLGMRLFFRVNRGVTLTPEGEYLYNSLQKPMAAISGAIERVQAMQEGRRTLRICCTSTYMFNSDYDPLRLSIQRFQEEYPSVDVQESILEWNDMPKELLFGSSDILICQDFVVKGLENVEYICAGMLGWYLVMAENNPLCTESLPTPEQLQTEPMYVLTTEKRSSMEARILPRCRAIGFEPASLIPVSNILTLMQLLGRGRGFSIIGKMDSRSPHAAIRYYPLDPAYIGSERICIAVAWNQHNQKSEIQRFLHIVRQFTGADTDNPINASG